MTDRPAPALLIGSAVANGVAVARRAQAAQASPQRAAPSPLSPPAPQLAPQPAGTPGLRRDGLREGPFHLELFSQQRKVCAQLCRPSVCSWGLGLLREGGKGGKEGRRGDRRGGDRRGQDRRGAALDLLSIGKSFPKCGFVSAASHSPGQEELCDGSRSHRPGWQLAEGRALPPVTPLVLSPAPRAFLRPHLPLGGQGVPETHVAKHLVSYKFISHVFYPPSKIQPQADSELALPKKHLQQLCWLHLGWLPGPHPAALSPLSSKKPSWEAF